LSGLVHKGEKSDLYRFIESPEHRWTVKILLRFMIINGASSNHLWTLTPPCFTLRAARLRRLFVCRFDFQAARYDANCDDDHNGCRKRRGLRRKLRRLSAAVVAPGREDHQARPTGPGSPAPTIGPGTATATKAIYACAQLAMQVDRSYTNFVSSAYLA
jgi:hypothetical protein